MKQILTGLTAALILITASAAQAATFRIDDKGAHAFVQFRIKHLGYSWLYGRFNDFEGQFQFDENNPDAASVEVVIDTASIDSNHAERDKHLRSDDFLDVDEYPQARFVSTSADLDAQGNGTITGDLTLHGKSAPVTLQVESIGAGEDPWGGYRRGFEARGRFALADYGIDYDLGPESREVELILSVEGVRQ